jgi:hypothetical protein
MIMRSSVLIAAATSLLASSSVAQADDAPAGGSFAFGDGAAPTGDQPAPEPRPDRPRDARDAAPLVGTTVSAFGAPAWSAGAAGYAGVLGLSRATPGTQAVEPGGGARLWASPVDRLTVLVELDRRYYADFGPAVTGMVRIAGDRRRGWAVGAGLTYRADSFAELGGELEGAMHLSFARAGFHSDVNVVAGGGLEESEADGEVKLRLGYDVTSWMRVGADGRFRHRLSGTRTLPGGRTDDVMGGPEVLFGYRNLFMALAGGPSTVGVASGYGWTGTGTFGAAVF